jgi:hypothetical protein
MISNEQIRLVVCGPIGSLASAIVGSLLFHWLVKHWYHWIPLKVGKKGKNRLLKEHKNTIRIAKISSLAGLLLGLFFYQSGWMNDHDWRGLGIGVGLMSVLPVAYIMAVNISRGTENVKEAMVAFAIDQRTPTTVLFVFMGFCFVAGMISVISLLLRPPQI